MSEENTTQSTRFLGTDGGADAYSHAVHADWSTSKCLDQTPCLFDYISKQGRIALSSSKQSKHLYILVSLQILEVYYYTNNNNIDVGEGVVKGQGCVS